MGKALMSIGLMGTALLGTDLIGTDSLFDTVHFARARRPASCRGIEGTTAARDSLPPMPCTP